MGDVYATKKSGWTKPLDPKTNVKPNDSVERKMKTSEFVRWKKFNFDCVKWRKTIMLLSVLTEIHRTVRFSSNNLSPALWPDLQVTSITSNHNLFIDKGIRCGLDWLVISNAYFFHILHEKPTFRLMDIVFLFMTTKGNATLQSLSYR